MLYRIITGDKTTSFLVILIISLLVWMPAFFKTDVFSPDLAFQMPLYQYINLNFHDHVLLLNLTAFLFVLIQGFILVRINTRYNLLQKRTFLPALFYIILSGYLPELHLLNGVLIATFFIIFAINVLIKSYASEPNSYGFFEAGLYTGLGSLFYAPLLYFIVFIWISTKILRTFYWREYLYSFLGIIIPYLFFLCGLFFFDYDVTDFFKILTDHLYNGFPGLNMDLVNKIFLAYSALLIIIASVHMLNAYQFKKIYIRNFFQIMFWLFIISLLIFNLLSGFNTYLSYIISIPVAFILTHYFLTSKNTRINQILLYTLILGIIFLSVNDWMKWI